MAFYLVGDFNGWCPGDARYRFRECTASYGDEQPNQKLALGGHSLETQFHPGRIRFKIVRGGSWDHQWSVPHSHNDTQAPVDKHCFETRNGLRSYCLAYRGGGTPPHAEFDYPGGGMRWDFHPDSHTLTIHDRFERAPSMDVAPWASFSCGTGMRFDTWRCLPYGFQPDQSDRYPVCYMFDGRALFYGEDFNFGVWNNKQRQWPRVLDALARHGVIAPTVIIALGVPYQGSHYCRRKAYLDTGNVHKIYARAIRKKVLPEAERAFHLSHDPDYRYLAGHSNGGDMAISLLVEHPELFRGVVAVSPGAASRTLHLASLASSAKSRLRVALSYSSSEIAPSFLTTTAGVREGLSAASIPHLVQYLPDSSHDSATTHQFLPGLFGFVLS